MYIQEYINLKKELYDTIWNFITCKDENSKLANENFQKLITLIENQKIKEDMNEFKILLHLLLKIFKYHHGEKTLFNNIKRILLFFKDNIKEIFTNTEIFLFFKNSFPILLFLVQNKILDINNSLLRYINRIKSYHVLYFFYPEIKNLIDEESLDKIKNQISNEYGFDEFDKFESYRQLGENHNHICSLIRSDSIEDFVIYIHKNDISSKSTVKPSLFETNSFLMKKSPTLIEYSAFFGSINIFNYLRLNDVECTEKTLIYAIHGRNPEIIDALINNFGLETHIECFHESIKCHYEDISIYICDNFIQSEELINSETYKESLVSFSLRYRNFRECPQKIDNNQSIFEELCKYNYFNLVKLYMKEYEVYDPFVKSKGLIKICANKNSVEIVNFLLTKIGYKISSDYFSNCKKLTRLEIPTNITSLGLKSFSGCISLLYIKIPSSVTEIVSESFQRCSSLKEIVIPSSVDSFGINIFDYCVDLEQVIFDTPSKIEQFHDTMFCGCESLKRVVLPSAITNFYEVGFSKCRFLRKIEIPSLNEKINLKCENLPEDELIIPSCVTFIRSHCFYNCDLLKKIKLPPSLFCIESSSFENCTSLVSITIPSTVTKIGVRAFSECKSLVSIDIPPTVEKIEYGAFESCSSLTQITLPPLLKRIECLKSCTSLVKVIIPSSATIIDHSAFEECTALKEVVIPSSVTAIYAKAFYKCSSLKKINIPPLVSEIGMHAFAYCISLEIVDISPSAPITIFNQYSFSNCTSLKELILPSSVQILDFWSFDYCSSLTKVEFPDSIVEIRGASFGGCSSLKEIIIPPSVKLIGSLCFADCVSLEKVTINSCDFKYNNEVFRNCTSLRKLYVHSNIDIRKFRLNGNVEVIPI